MSVSNAVLALSDGPLMLSHAEQLFLVSLFFAPGEVPLLRRLAGRLGATLHYYLDLPADGPADGPADARH